MCLKNPPRGGRVGLRIKLFHAVLRLWHWDLSAEGTMGSHLEFCKVFGTSHHAVLSLYMQHSPALTEPESNDCHPHSEFLFPWYIALPLWRQRSWNWSLASSSEGCAEGIMRKTPPKQQQNHTIQTRRLMLYLTSALRFISLWSHHLFVSSQSRLRSGGVESLGQRPKVSHSDSGLQAQPLLPSLRAFVRHTVLLPRWLGQRGHH